MRFLVSLFEQFKQISCFENSPCVPLQSSTHLQDHIIDRGATFSGGCSGAVRHGPVGRHKRSWLHRPNEYGQNADYRNTEIVLAQQKHFHSKCSETPPCWIAKKPIAELLKALPKLRSLCRGARSLPLTKSPSAPRPFGLNFRPFGCRWFLLQKFPDLPLATSGQSLSCTRT